MGIRKEDPDIVGDGIVQVMPGSYLITNNEVIEKRLLDELIISDDYKARFDFTELGNLMRNCKHSAIVDIESGFDLPGLEELVEYAKAQFKSTSAKLKPIVYIKGCNECTLPHLMNNFESTMSDVVRPGFLISDNLKEEVSATIFFFDKQEKADTVWQDKIEETIQAKLKSQQDKFPYFRPLTME